MACPLWLSDCFLDRASGVYSLCLAQVSVSLCEFLGELGLTCVELVVEPMACGLS